MTTSGIILVDYSWVVNLYYYGFKDKYVVKDGSKIFIGNILGLTLLVENILKKYPNYKILFCMDGYCKKKKVCSEYKAQREHNDEVHLNNGYIVNILSNVPNVSFCKSEDHEADELIAHLAYKLKTSFDDLIIYSGDKDFWQLSGNFKVSNEFKKGFKIITPNDVFSKFGTSVDNLLKLRILEGDKSDNLKPPVPNIRKTFKLDLCEHWHDLSKAGFEEALDNLANNSYDSKNMDKLDAYRENIDKVLINLEMMDLTRYENYYMEYRVFRAKDVKKSLINYFELGQFERFLYDNKF